MIVDMVVVGVVVVEVVVVVVVIVNPFGFVVDDTDVVTLSMRITSNSKSLNEFPVRDVSAVKIGVGVRA